MCGLAQETAGSQGTSEPVLLHEPVESCCRHTTCWLHRGTPLLPGLRAGLRQLATSGVLPDGSPAAAARFLRDQAARLDKAQVGELLGHHEEHSIQVSWDHIVTWSSGRGKERGGMRVPPIQFFKRRCLHQQAAIPFQRLPARTCLRRQHGSWRVCCLIHLLRPTSLCSAASQCRGFLPPCRSCTPTSTRSATLA
jgi:hypothetical protein